MNIELDEVVVMDVSDEALEQAACGAQGGRLMSDRPPCWVFPYGRAGRLALADR